ncbi:MAG TPA: family 78 glycoside hydrolase catalytic domain [Firmicutes bacterium]|nr:family 78 glycoside hydrolase catalytic domain [Bacillota bacterium]
MKKAMKRVLSGMLSVMLGVTGMPVITPALAADQPVIYDLKVDDLTEPLGVDDVPTFSWLIRDEGFGGAQSAYRIRVATTAENAAAGRGDVWDSGKVESADNFNVKYGGEPLSSKTGYYWTVSAWDEADDLLGTSETAYFHTGIYDAEEWEGEWIGYPQAQTEKMTLDGAYWIWLGGSDTSTAGSYDAGTQYFRKTFTVEDPDNVTLARLAWTADDQSTMYFNGVEIGSTRSWTYGGMADVTDLVVAGENCIAMAATNGAGGNAGAIARMLIDFAEPVEVEEPEEPASGNLALGKSVTASSAENNPDWGWSASFLVDGDTRNVNPNNPNERSGYSSSSSKESDHSEWVYVDLGKVSEVNKVVFYPSAQQADGVWTASGAPKAYEIQVSDDATKWDTVYSGSFETAPAAGPQTAEFAATDARYVRFYASSLIPRENEYRLQLSEMEVYGVTDQPAVEKINLAEGKTVEAFTAENNPDFGWSPAFLVDGNRENVNPNNSNERAGYSSAGNSADHSEWVYVDLGEAAEVNQVVFYPSAQQADGVWTATGVPAAYEIQVSDDAEKWETVYTGGFETAPAAGAQTVDFETVSARYVRFYASSILPRNGDYRLQLSEMEVYGTATRPVEPVKNNLAKDKAVEASSAEDNPSFGWSPAFLVDGDRENVNPFNSNERAGYSSTGNSADHSEWVYVDLGESTDVNQVVFYPAAQQADGVWTATGVPAAYEIQVSDDAAKWETVYTGGFETAPAAGPQTVDFETVSARYVRFYASSILPRNGDYRLQLSEMEVYNVDRPEMTTRLDIVTDTTWTGCTEEVEGWNQIQCTAGSWTKPQQHVPYGSDPWKTNLSINDVQNSSRAAVNLRREFQVEKEVASAYAYICGLGFFTLTVNGQPVTDSVMNPAPTQYDYTSLYCVYDVAELLQAGGNAVGVELGNSFYNETGGVWNWPNAHWRDNPKCLLNLEIIYTDGSSQTIVTDRSWKVSRDGPITSNSLYYGDEYDARKALVDGEGRSFDQAGYDDSAWIDASVLATPVNEDGEAAALKWQHEEPNMRTATFKPSRIQQLDEDSWVVTCPVMTTGWAKLTGINIPEGQELTITYSEKQHEDGTVMKLGGLDGEGENWFSEANICQDHYISDGTADAAYEPRYSYKGYQYIQIDGWQGEFTADNIEMYLINNAMEQAGSFETSSEMINALQAMMVRTVLNNQQGRITDTPVYEKNGWTGDANVMLDTILYNFDAENVMETFLNMLADTQEAFGNVADIVPSADSFTDNHPTWNTVFPFGITRMCQYYGNYTYAEEMYEALRTFAMTDINIIRGQGWLWPGGSYGDWCSPSNLTDGNAPISAGASEGSKITDNAMLYGALTEIANLTRLLADNAYDAGDRAQAEAYAADLAVYEDALENMYAAYNAKFFDEANGCYDTGEWSQVNDRTRYRQTSQLASLAYGLVPAEYEQGVVDSLVEDIIAKGYHLDTGVVGTKLILPMLDKYGYEDLAFRITTQTTYPSWGYWLAQGATSCWENWETTTRSLDHHMFGSASEWFYSGLAGIRDITGGYETFTIDPAFTGSLDYVNCSIETVRGTLSSNWKLNDDGTITMELTVPYGSTAKAYLPTAEADGVLVNGQAADAAEGVTAAGLEDGRYCLTLSAGSYSIVTGSDLVELYKFALNDAIETAEALDTDLYPADVLADVEAALEEARRLSAAEAGEAFQKQLNDAEAALVAAIAGAQGSEARQALYEALAQYGDADMSDASATEAAAYASAVLTATKLAQDYTTDDEQLKAAQDKLEDIYRQVVLGESENLARGKAVDASSAENNPSWGWQVSNLVDGDRQNANSNGEYAGHSSNTSVSTDHSEWVSIDLGESMEVNKVVFYPSCQNEDGNMVGYGSPKAYDIRVSDDGTEWRTVYTGELAEIPAYGPQTAEFDTVSVRYVQLYAASLFPRNGEYRLQLSEMEVYHIQDFPEQPEGLTYLELSSGKLSPVFDYFTSSYTAMVEKAVRSITLTPYATDGTAITVNGQTVSAGQASQPIALQVGENDITLTAGGVTYTLTVTRSAEGPDIIPGDMDDNGKVDIVDVMAACRVLARKNTGMPASPDEILRGDLSGDDTITIEDIMLICRVIAAGRNAA